MNRIQSHLQRGVALITALLTVALAALIATHLLDRTQLTLDAIGSSHDYVQAQAMAQSGTDYARAVLAEDARSNTIDHEGEAWATPLPPLRVELGDIGGRIEDLQGRWNLNNLAPRNGAAGQPGQPDPATLAVYRRLLLQLGLAPTLADTLATWLGAGTQAAGDAPPQHTLTDITNLRQVPGYDAVSIERLRPHVVALAGSQPVNVNTAPAQVLAALFAELDLTSAETIVQARRRIPFRDAADFLQRLPVTVPGTSVPITTTSQHFLIRVQVQVGTALANRQAIVRRSGNAWPIVLGVSLS
jgi:general secretion pathway protein K